MHASLSASDASRPPPPSRKTYFYGRGWSDGAAALTAAPFDRHVVCSVSGPEPGYIATGLMFAVMARAVLEDRQVLKVRGGVFTPGGLLGSGGAAAVHAFIGRCNAVGVVFKVESTTPVGHA